MAQTIHAEARRKAKDAGERFYETGVPCKRGHMSKRYTGTGLCAMCATEATLRVQAKKREHPNRTRARERGEMHYSTGVPCKQGHDMRLVSNGVCTECGPRWTRRYLEARPGLEAEWARKRRAKDPSGHREASKKWYHGNREKAREIHKRWKTANPERVKLLARAGTNIYRTKNAGGGGRFTADDICRMMEEQNGCCAVCGSSDRLELDHIMPVSLGGSSDPHNLQLLCLPCSRSKGAKHPERLKTT